MIFFSNWIITVSSVSTTDCYSPLSTFWNLHGIYKTDNANIYFLDSNESSNYEKHSYLEYTSKRHRKKWMISLCGSFEHSFLNFTSSSENISIEIQKSLGKNIFHYFDVSLIHNGNINKEAKVRYSNNEETCFSIISGRGYLGMFTMKNIHKQEGDQIFASQLEVPRNHVFRYYSRKPSNISLICVGDFFGNKRMSVKTGNDQWDSHVRDFL
ncbi:hypothetical protein M9Y10_034489 [Tritrichomonas musculus]|uniref:Uncharacterized protein n=1 Tax=Tritrichomonas musculus TaxID=1915356 RepID=A0ABR2KF50_9EUKA